MESSNERSAPHAERGCYSRISGRGVEIGLSYGPIGSSSMGTTCRRLARLPASTNSASPPPVAAAAMIYIHLLGRGWLGAQRDKACAASSDKCAGLHVGGYGWEGQGTRRPQ